MFRSIFGKGLGAVITICAPLFFLAGCSTNPATGQSQFTALMSPAQENQVGAQEHPQIMAEYGEYDNAEIVNYVRRIGKRVTANTERPDVEYKFFVLDSPIVNAFALPGGYIYVSRGLLALANSEAELAGVLAHEAGHITGRHSAARYSRGVVTSLGASLISAALNTPAASQALNLGSELYLKSYSRDQENEADSLGIRYLKQAGYDPRAMTWFLESLKASADLEARIDGRKTAASMGYFSTHPATQDRVNKTRSEAMQAGTPAQAMVKRDEYLQLINGMTYGDSKKQGFAIDQSFYHPEIGFAYDVPDGFDFKNTPSSVVSRGPGNAVIIFDMAARKDGQGPMDYLIGDWMTKQKLDGPETITVNGMPAATASFRGAVNNIPMVIRVIAVQFDDKRFARFQIGIPNNLSSSVIQDLKRTTYSLRRMSAQEKEMARPLEIRLVAAEPGASVGLLAARQAVNDHQETYFRVLNGLKAGENIQAGRLYKIISR